MLTRNRLLAGTAALVALSLVGPAAAQAPIKIGELNSYKVFPAFLEPYKKGIELAVEEVNAAGGVLGRKIEVVSRDDNGNPGDAVRVAEELLSREGAVVPDRHLPVERRPRRRRLRQAAQGAVHRRRAADRQDRLGLGQRLHVPPAHLDLHADGDAHPRRRQAEQEALGDRLSELRVRPVGDGRLQEAPQKEKQPDVEFVRRAGAAAGQDRCGARWRRPWPTPSPTRSSSLFGPDLAKFVREGQTRGLFKGVEVFNLLAGEPEYLDPLKEESPDGWYVTGYPWSEPQDARAHQFLNAYQAKFKDYPRLGSVVGYATVMSAVEAIKKAGSLDQEKLVAGRKRPRRSSRRSA